MITQKPFPFLLEQAAILGKITEVFIVVCGCWQVEISGVGGKWERKQTLTARLLGL